MIDHTRTEWWRPNAAVDRGDRGETPTTAEPQVPDSAVPFWATMAYTFVLFLAPQQIFPALVPLRIALLTAVAAITTYLFARFTTGKPVLMRTREMTIALGLVSWAIFTVPFSPWPGESVSFLFEIYLKTLAIFWLVSHTVNTLARLRQVVWALTLMTVPMAATALDNFISGTFVPGSDRIAGYDAPLTGNPNGLALVLNLILPLCVALFLSARRPWARTLLLGVIVLDVTAVILTFSRMGFLALATTLGLYLWKLRKRPERRWAVAILVIALACLPLLPSGYLDRVSTILNKESDPTGSAQTRWTDIVAAANLVVKNPLVGVGAGMNKLALNEERGPAWSWMAQDWLSVHNVYLAYAVDLGVPGLALFLLLLAACMQSTLSVQRRSAGVPASRELFDLAEGIQITLITYAVAALLDTSAYDPLSYYFGGLAVSIKTVYEAERPDRT